MKTGETVTELGFYSSECCSKEVIFDVGDTFTRCPSCTYLCKWEFEEEVLPSENAESPSDVAA
jgi:hypothetical protein